MLVHDPRDLALSEKRRQVQETKFRNFRSAQKVWGQIDDSDRAYILKDFGYSDVDGAIDRERADREGYDVEDMAVGLLRLEKGTVVAIESSFAGNIEEPNGTWLFGSRAGLRLEPLTLYREKDGEKKVTDIDVADVTPLSPTRQFVEAILNDEPIRICSGEEALIVTRMQELLYRSAEAGREVMYEESR